MTPLSKRRILGQSTHPTKPEQNQIMNQPHQVKIHPSAEVSPGADIGAGTAIWHQAQIREDVKIGADCIISKGVYVDSGVMIGNQVKIQNYVSIYHGVTIEDGVFCGPHCVFTNDKSPRAINQDGSLKSGDDWTVTSTIVQRGASIGANATIICGVTIGSWAMIGAGAVVTRHVPAYGLVLGNPARLRGFVCPCGARLKAEVVEANQVVARCPACQATVTIDRPTWDSAE